MTCFARVTFSKLQLLTSTTLTVDSNFHINPTVFIHWISILTLISYCKTKLFWVWLTSLAIRYLSRLILQNLTDLWLWLPSLYTLCISHLTGFLKGNSAIASGVHNYSWVFTPSTEEYQQTHWALTWWYHQQQPIRNPDRCSQTRLLHLIRGSDFYPS